MSMCPSCKNENVELVEVVDDETSYVAVTCLDCGLRGPRAHYESDEDEEVAEIDKLAWSMWNEMAVTMLPVWNPGDCGAKIEDYLPIFQMIQGRWQHPNLREEYYVILHLDKLIHVVEVIAMANAKEKNNNEKHDNGEKKND